jgi:hypothetical protein
MNELSKQRQPQSSEYASYYGSYVNLVPEGDIIEILTEQFKGTLKLLTTLPEPTETYRYAANKWSLREVVGHLIDTEWMFTTRALSFARGEKAPLPGMDQDVYAAKSNAQLRALSDLTKEWQNLRSAATQLFSSFDAATLKNEGTASEAIFSVRSLPYIIAGHERHHMNVIQERYLKS